MKLPEQLRILAITTQKTVSNSQLLRGRIGIAVRLSCVQKSPTAEQKRAGCFENILVPMDFSAAATTALRYAIDLARLSQSKLTLLHVVAPCDGADVNGAIEAATRELAALRQRESAASDHIEVSVQTGIPFVEITGRAAADGADLIVLARRQPAAAVEWTNGHTSERVVRYASCPVLLVKESAPSAVES